MFYRFSNFSYSITFAALFYLEIQIDSFTNFLDISTFVGMRVVQFPYRSFKLALSRLSKFMYFPYLPNTLYFNNHIFLQSHRPLRNTVHGHHELCCARVDIEVAPDPRCMIIFLRIILFMRLSSFVSVCMFYNMSTAYFSDEGYSISL